MCPESSDIKLSGVLNGKLFLADRRKQQQVLNSSLANIFLIIILRHKNKNKTFLFEKLFTTKV
jgi:hypothetical protein